MKSILIIGNLGSNAQRRNTSDGREIMTFSVAVNDKNNTTTWFNCVANLRPAQFDYLTKGQSVAVTGDLSVRMYNGNPDLTINVDRIELCGKKTDENQQEQPDTAPSHEIRVQPQQDGSTIYG